MVSILSIRVLVTGANGFIGRRLCTYLSRHGFFVRAAVRDGQTKLRAAQLAVCGDVGDAMDWQVFVNEVDCVVHLAARVHVIPETAADPLAEFRRVNVRATENLANHMVRSGAKRLIYLSSIKVNGERTEDCPFTAEDKPCPGEPYAVSKWEAEKVLLSVAQNSGMEVVVIRPPLVYGPHVKGNFLRLLKLVDKGVPLPLSGINNRRSMVSVYNLCDAIRVCLEHPKASGEVFLISDGKPLSTTRLLEILAESMGKKARLFKVPRGLLQFGGRLAGKAQEAERLLGSLEVNIEKSRRLLGWTPPLPADQGLAKTVEWYCANKGDYR